MPIDERVAPTPISRNTQTLFTEWAQAVDLKKSMYNAYCEDTEDQFKSIVTPRYPDQEGKKFDFADNSESMEEILIEEMDEVETKALGQQLQRMQNSEPTTPLGPSLMPGFD